MLKDMLILREGLVNGQSPFTHDEIEIVISVFSFSFTLFNFVSLYCTQF